MWKTRIALQQTLFICKFHFKSQESMSPKSDWVSSVLIDSFRKSNRFSFLDILIRQHLSILKGMLFLTVQSYNAFKSIWISIVLKPTLRNLASSAKSRGNYWSHIFGGGGQNMGPKILPCGTPLVTCIGDEFTPFIRTTCTRFVKYDSISFSSLFLMPVSKKIFKSIPWSTLSKALL